MEYRDAVSYIEEIPKFTKKHNLAHTRDFLKRLGNPGFDRKILHVAGTNGKGSVCAYMQCILKAEGKRVGFFTSPHLICMNERICIEGSPINNDSFLCIFRKIKQTVDAMKAEGIAHPSYFEFLFAMGMMAFEESDAEYIILETGLGGRLDATNSVPFPLLTVITSISLDHTQLLGNTISDIAYEKAGIIKKGVPVFCDGSNEEALNVIRRQAEIKGTCCREISKNAFEICEIGDKYIAFSRANAYDGDATWMLANSGLYQVMNACIAIAAMEYVFPVEQRHYDRWIHAVAAVVWEGRMEEVAPSVFLDGAHNPGAVEAFVESLEIHKEVLPVIVFSAAADKDYEAMIAILCRRLSVKLFIVTEIEVDRRVPVNVLEETFKKYTSRSVLKASNPDEALTLALDNQEQGGRIYFLGSLYLAGMMKVRLDRRNK